MRMTVYKLVAGHGSQVPRYNDTQMYLMYQFICMNEPANEISNNVVCATSKASDQPAHTGSLVRAFASCLGIL